MIADYVCEEFRVIQPPMSPMDFVDMIESIEKHNNLIKGDSKNLYELLEQHDTKVLSINSFSRFKDNINDSDLNKLHFLKITHSNYYINENLNLLSLNVSNNTVVFSCSLNEYTLEVRVVNRCFQQVIKKNGKELSKPRWLVETVLSFENRMKDLLYLHNSNEGIYISMEELCSEHTIWILKRYKKL